MLGYRALILNPLMAPVMPPGLAIVHSDSSQVVRRNDSAHFRRYLGGPQAGPWLKMPLVLVVGPEDSVALLVSRMSWTRSSAPTRCRTRGEPGDR